ncbi:MAG: PhoU domain-containing protein [Candidatus Kariarchaeaceae archaeon]
MIRRVQQIGKSGSYILTLPKSWCEENAIEQGTEVELGIDQIKEGTILITLINRVRNEEEDQEIMSFGDLNNQRMIGRAILGRYLDGYDSFVLTKIPDDQKLKTRQTIKTLIQKLHVDEDTDIVDGKVEISFSQNLISPLIIIENLYWKAKNMVIDAVDSYFDDDRELAKDVISRDEDADKEYFRIVRTLKKILKDPILGNELFSRTEGTSFSIVDSLDLRMIATYLENLADSAENLSKETMITKNDEITKKKEVENEFNQLYGLLDSSFTSFKLENQAKAFSILTEVRELKKTIEKKFEKINPALRNTLNELMECVIDIADLVGE